uniref:DNA-directed RNA polymerase subunit beta n=1 Tax=Cryptomonas sp. CCAC 1634B TaxID=2051848 RepID=A0A679CAB5_9CRYP|nr:RNA polymerase subunit beta [Cryptomonas sp. CCAC 1634B]
MKFAMFSLPDLVEIQRASFSWFLEEGLVEELNHVSPVRDYTGKLELHLFGDLYTLRCPKYSPGDSRKNDSTYSVQMYVPVRLINKDTGEVKEQEVFIGDLPLMTDRGSFIVNGDERVIINQVVRSPGVYYTLGVDAHGKRTYSGSLVSNRGSWIRFEIDKNDLIWVRIDKTRKILAHVFLKSMGLSDDDIYEGLRHPEFLKNTYRLEGNYSTEEALIAMYAKLRPGEPSTVNGGQHLLYSRFFDPKRYDLGLVGRYKLNKKLGVTVPGHIRVLTPQDLLASIDYLINLKFGLGNIDDIDHLGNRRVRSVGELLQSQIRIGLHRLEKIIRERMTVCERHSLIPATLINPKPVIASVKEFFCSSQLSQFMDQTNPLAEVTHKRRVSSLGPGGLSRDRAGFAVRDIHPSHYGRICPIETPEGPNAGLIGVLATHARINFYGFIETPFYTVTNGRVFLDDAPVYLTADQEDKFRIASGDIFVSRDGYLQQRSIPIRYEQEFTSVSAECVNYVSVSPVQVVSVATALIPFLEHDDANRALMGSNMQRQAVPLLYPESPLIGTGLEASVARDSGMVVVSYSCGTITYVSADKVCVLDSTGVEVVYSLQKYQRSNQDTCINQRPLVWVGEDVSPGQILADGSATEGGELALGQNVLVAYVPWEGYNYEDAFLISERLVFDNVYTSVHIERYEIDARQTRLGSEEISRELPNVSEHLLRNLDCDGIVLAGSWVESGDILVGKLTPKSDSEHPPEGKLLRAIFGEKLRDTRETSLRVPNGGRGRVLEVRVFTREKGDELSTGANLTIRVYVAQSRRIQVGDKMSGRHGNKGIISKILPVQDMPYLPDGTPVDIVLNPLGVPSRMNVGQIFECLLGLAAENTNKRFKVIPFDEMYGAEASRILINDELMKAALLTGKEWLFNPHHPGKVAVFDGRTGEQFDNPITVGISYMLKLVHLVDDKIHARSTGPYSLVTQQPLGGRAQHGGQRLGEMEVWALEAFGAAYTLQELLTVKSDDMQGRNATLSAIITGKPIPKPGTPESFRVLVRELHSLGLDIGMYKIENSSSGHLRSLEVDLMSDSDARTSSYKVLRI